MHRSSYNQVVLIHTLWAYYTNRENKPPWTPWTQEVQARRLSERERQQDGKVRERGREKERKGRN